MIVCKVYNETYLLASIYGPNEDNPGFYEKLNRTIEEFDAEHIIVAGDLNFLINPEIDSVNYARENNIRAKQAFLELAYSHNLIDAWRHMHPAERRYTWTQQNPRKAGRLDMFFTSDHLLNSIADADITPGYRTDHSAITLTIECKQKRGNGLWKFNISHLADDDYSEVVEKCIVQTIKQYAVPIYEHAMFRGAANYHSIHLTVNDCLFYETLIMMIRGESVKYAKQKAKRTRAAQESLLTQIAEAEREFVMSGLNSDAEQARIDALKRELEEMRHPIIDGLITRSRVSWHEKGERNTKYFLSLEKRNYNKKNIQFIKDGDNIISNSKDILDKFSQTYQNKYKSNRDITPQQSFIANHVTGKLSTHDRLKLDKDIELPELTTALNSMKSGKTPGSNGFPVEFFRHFWTKLGPFIHRAFKTALQEGNDLSSHKEGIITLIPKKGKSPHSCKGWRPITLLNVDYKIISTVIASRLRKVLAKITNPAQTAYMYLRTIYLREY